MTAGLSNLPAPLRRTLFVAIAAVVAVVAAVVLGSHRGDAEPAAHPRLTPPAPSADPAGVALAHQLVAFARGDAGSRFPASTQVRLFRDGHPWTTLSTSDAENRASFSLCPGFGPTRCVTSYLSGLALTSPYTVVDRVPDCFPQQDRNLSRKRGGGAHTVYAFPSRTDACHAVSVLQVRYDAPDRLVAVNVATVRPAGTGVAPADDAQRAAATAFLDFAQGRTDHLPGDASVALYLEGYPSVTLSADEARNRAAYRLCGDDPRGQCGATPIEQVQGIEHPVISSAASCFSDAGLLGTEPGLDTVLITDQGVDPCRSSSALELRFDDRGRIRAVNSVESYG